MNAIENINFAVSSTGLSLGKTATPAMKVYKDSISSANQLISSNYQPASATAVGFGNTVFTAAGVTDLEVASGSSRTIVVTLDTSDAGVSANDTLSVGIAQAGDIQWTDDGGTSEYRTVDTLPLAGKTLVY